MSSVTGQQRPLPAMSSVFLAPVAVAGGMRIRGSTLSDDVLTHVLAASPTFSTLYAAAGVCKTWQGVFVAHPRSLVLTVAHNVVGPALPQAIRFLRYPYPPKTENSWGSDNEDRDEEDDEATEDDTDDEDDAPKKSKPPMAKEKKVPASSPESDDIGDLSPEERARLQKNAGLVNELEDRFSLRHKDRTSKTSQLTALESHRFARAMYRIMLYCEVFYLPLNLDDIDSMEDEEDDIEKIQKARQKMLEEYSTAELLEIRDAVDFLHELIKEVLDDDDDFDRLKDICIATGPKIVLQAYLARRSEVFEEALEPEVMTSGEENPFFGGFFSIPLETLWTKRKVDPPKSQWDAILDEVRGQSDTCTQCGVVAGFKLWNEANWQNLINVDFCALLMGKLSENDVETAALIDLFMSTCDSVVVVSEIFDMRTTDFAAWKKSDDLCSTCLDKLIAAHLHLWLFKRKVADGWKPTQNCWYGYSCNTQVHKRNHAKEKNHLCVPIR
ncbi:hypothetical protein B0H15DRAFT_821305 [Mycena belliarum]|uniref:Aprataxin and PNK-like factor PBZ domain-containing protein n=1 Tax=Mycena belliarum TaxID=1033014 RepID=A0AAD6UC16_9AGAR|nr:hypothetical protein B0H15DRAFT_821305 [Mycena belliae]